MNERILEIRNFICEKSKYIFKLVKERLMAFAETIKGSRFYEVIPKKYIERIPAAALTGLFLLCLSIGANKMSLQEHALGGDVHAEHLVETMPEQMGEHFVTVVVPQITVTEAPGNEDLCDKGSVIVHGKLESIGTRYVSGTCVNFRKGPSLESEVLNKLYRNTPVELMSNGENGFAVIRYNGQIGYMFAEYLSETEIIVDYSPQYNYAYITDLAERVASIAKNNQGTQPCLSGYCAKWVSGIYQAAGLGYPGGHAIDYWNRWHTSGSRSSENIPVGAVVVGSGSGSELGNRYGHVGVYLGNGMVADNIGYHRVTTLENWIAYNDGTCQGCTGFIGWVWPFGSALY